MKVKELFEARKNIKGNVSLPRKTTELKYKGVIVDGNFICAHSRITSLEGAPSRVSGSFDCFNTSITSLEGAPSYVGVHFYCFNTKIESLHDVHKQIKYIGGAFFLSNTVKSHVLGVMMIKGVEVINFFGGSGAQEKVTAIINNHLLGDRDVHACQEELIEAGFAEYAKL